MSKRNKRKRRGHYEPRVTKAESDRATAAKEKLREPTFTVGKYSGIQTWTREPVPTGVDLLRPDQDSPPVVVR